METVLDVALRHKSADSQRTDSQTDYSNSSGGRIDNKDTGKF